MYQKRSQHLSSVVTFHHLGPSARIELIGTGIVQIWTPILNLPLKTWNPLNLTSLGAVLDNLIHLIQLPKNQESTYLSPLRSKFHSFSSTVLTLCLCLVLQSSTTLVQINACDAINDFSFGYPVLQPYLKNF